MSDGCHADLLTVWTTYWPRHERSPPIFLSFQPPPLSGLLVHLFHRGGSCHLAKCGCLAHPIACSRLVYDSFQIKQFNRGKMCKYIDSIIMNPSNLNIWIQSCYEGHTNRLNQLSRISQMIQSNQSINSIYMLTFFGTPSISLTFFRIF